MTPRCLCGKPGDYTCDWPVPTKNSGTCDKDVCETCRIVDGAKDYCRMHRGEPARTAEELAAAGRAEAENAARILGVKWP